MLEVALIILIGLLSFNIGLIVGGVGYANAAEKEAKSGVLKIGTKLYKIQPLILAKDD